MQNMGSPMPALALGRKQTVEGMRNQYAGLSQESANIVVDIKQYIDDQKVSSFGNNLE